MPYHTDLSTKAIGERKATQPKLPAPAPGSQPTTTCRTNRLTATSGPVNRLGMCRPRAKPMAASAGRTRRPTSIGERKGDPHTA